MALNVEMKPDKFLIYAMFNAYWEPLDFGMTFKELAFVAGCFGMCAFMIGRRWKAVHVRR